MTEFCRCFRFASDNPLRCDSYLHGQFDIFGRARVTDRREAVKFCDILCREGCEACERTLAGPLPNCGEQVSCVRVVMVGADLTLPSLVGRWAKLLVRNPEVTVINCNPKINHSSFTLWLFNPLSIPLLFVNVRMLLAYFEHAARSIFPWKENESEKSENAF